MLLGGQRHLLALAILLMLGQVSGRAQSPVSGSETIPQDQPLAQLGTIPGASMSTAVSPENITPPALPLEAFRDPRWTPPPGWFADLELGLTLIQLQQHETGQVFVGRTLTLFELPSATINPIVSPRIGIGYRFPDVGELTLTYQLIDGQGTSTLSDLAGTGPASLKSRMDLSVVDLQWWGSQISLGPQWDMKWHAGARFANIYIDTNAHNSLATQGISNLDIVGGPVAGLDVWRALAAPGLALYGRVFGAFLFGALHQSYEFGVPGFYTVNHAGSGGPPQPGDLQSPMATPLILDVEVGLGYTPPWARWTRFTAGYQFQGWWNMGTATATGSGGTLPGDVQFMSHTFFGRAELHW